MKLLKPSLILIFSLCIASLMAYFHTDNAPVKKDFFEPYDWAGVVRNYPDFSPDPETYLLALKSAEQEDALLRSSSSFNISWQLEGPGNIGGRINCLFQDPVVPTTFYAGSASGGVWKTTDDCQNWFPVSDDLSFLAISDIKMHPGNSDVVYAATGDENISGYVFVGDGIYKSNDAGATWTNIGLSNTGIVTEIVLHPTDTSVIYAAAMGYPFQPDANRGVYKSTNGGLSWNQVLFVDSSAGVIDLVMDPFNPDILYAASWNRLRTNSSSIVFGPDAIIWISTNGGATWNPAGSGLPVGDMSRIGLAVSGTTPGRVFAVYVDPTLEFAGIYRSDNYGAAWSPINSSGVDPGAMGGFGWYFGKLIVNPSDDNEIFLCAVDLWKTDNNGSSWSGAWFTSDPHADKHDVIHLGGQNWLLATDGGIYRTNDDGITWTDADNIPNNQFYRITYNPHVTGLYAGGLQDNGTVSGNAVSFNAWNRIFGGDGFTIRYHPTDPNILFVEYQNGQINYSDDGGFSFFDATIGIDFSDRRNWDMPYVFNPQNPNEMLTGTFQSYINSTGTNVFWQPGGQDLTDGVIFAPRFHVVSAVDWSPLNSNNLLIGTSDGNVWFSSNKGGSWTSINAGLPDRYITSVHFSPNTANRVFVSVSGYKDGINQPHIFRSDNNGTAWVNISGDLPSLAINDVLILPGNDNVIFVATDGGVYGTVNGGISWLRTGNNMPYVPVYDLELEPVQRRLMAGTFGRSLYTVNVDTLLSTQGLNVATLSASLKVYPTVFNTEITIETLEQELMASVYSLSGQLMSQHKLEKGQNRIDLSGLLSGTYLISANSGDRKGSWKIIKL